MAQISQNRMHSALTPLTVEDARRLIQSYVERYNTVRLQQRDRLCDAAGYAGGTDRRRFMRRADR